MNGDTVLNSAHQFRDTDEEAPAQPIDAQIPEKAFDHVQP